MLAVTLAEDIGHEFHESLSPVLTAADDLPGPQPGDFGLQIPGGLGAATEDVLTFNENPKAFTLATWLRPVLSRYRYAHNS